MRSARAGESATHGAVLSTTGEAQACVGKPEPFPPGFSNCRLSRSGAFRRLRSFQPQPGLAPFSRATAADGLATTCRVSASWFALANSIAKLPIGIVPIPVTDVGRRCVTRPIMSRLQDRSVAAPMLTARGLKGTKLEANDFRQKTNFKEQLQRLPHHRFFSVSFVKHFETQHRTAMVSPACGQGGPQP